MNPMKTTTSSTTTTNSTNHHAGSPRILHEVAALAARLGYCDGSEDYVRVVRALVATRDERAVRVLASLLDGTGPVAEESVAGLVALAREGIDVAPAMRRCTDGDDYESIRHAHRVLAELGDEASREWLRADDAERIDAYLERKGFSDAEDTPAPPREPVANETNPGTGSRVA